MPNAPFSHETPRRNDGPDEKGEVLAFPPTTGPQNSGTAAPPPAFRAAALLHAALRTWLAAPFRPRRRAPALSALRVPAGRAEPGHARAPCLRAAVSTASVLGHLTAAVAHAPKTFSSSSEPWRPRLSAPPHPRPSRCGDLAPTPTVGCGPDGRASGRAAAALAAVRIEASRLRGSACPVETWRTPRANGRPRKRRAQPPLFHPSLLAAARWSGASCSAGDGMRSMRALQNALAGKKAGITRALGPLLGGVVRDNHSEATAQGKGTHQPAAAQGS
ncbi:hypothetical protein ACRRTK_022786 [Alexandromys fortis]